MSSDAVASTTPRADAARDAFAAGAGDVSKAVHDATNVAEEIHGGVGS